MTPTPTQPMRPKAVGVWCQPLEGLLYDLNILPEQIEEFSQNWRIMKVIQEMHAHFEASELFIDTLESENAELRAQVEWRDSKTLPDPIRGVVILCCDYELFQPFVAIAADGKWWYEGKEVEPICWMPCPPRYTPEDLRRFKALKPSAPAPETEKCGSCGGVGEIGVESGSGEITEYPCPTCTGIKPKTEGDGL